MKTIDNQPEKWSNEYHETIKNQVYPTEWVIRTIAGANYPNFKFDKRLYIGKKIIDISCGDGRNLELLLNLGFDVYATEINEDTISILREKYPLVKFFLGFNHKHSFSDSYFDYALACGSFYYLEPETCFEDNLKEINRILKPNGYLFTNMPSDDHYILNKAIKLPKNEFLITSDPHFFRNGYRWQVVNSEIEIQKLFDGFLQVVACSKLSDDYFGYLISNFIVVCRNI